MSTDPLPPYARQALARLTSADRRFLPDTIAACLGHADALRAILTAPEPDPEAYVAARQRLTDSIVALADLVGAGAVPPALVAMTRLRINREQELPSGGCMGFAKPADWDELVRDTARQALADLGRLREAANSALWSGDDWEALEPLVRRLLTHMHGRGKADLRELCPDVWGKDYADVSESARETATSKANRFLCKRQSPRLLRKVPGEPLLIWR